MESIGCGYWWFGGVFVYDLGYQNHVLGGSHCLFHRGGLVLTKCCYCVRLVFHMRLVLGINFCWGWFRFQYRLDNWSSIWFWCNICCFWDWDVNLSHYWWDRVSRCCLGWPLVRYLVIRLWVWLCLLYISNELINSSSYFWCTRLGYNFCYYPVWCFLCWTLFRCWKIDLIWLLIRWSQFWAMFLMVYCFCSFFGSWYWLFSCWDCRGCCWFSSFRALSVLIWCLWICERSGFGWFYNLLFCFIGCCFRSTCWLMFDWCTSRLVYWF